MVRNSPENEDLGQFLQPNTELPLYVPKHNNGNSFLSPGARIVQDMDPEFAVGTASHEMQELPIRTDWMDSEDIEVYVISTSEAKSAFKKFTLYEIETCTVSSGRRTFCEHRFQDFKRLDECLRKKHEIQRQLPNSGLGVSSTAPGVVQERKELLQTYLNDLVRSPEILHDPALIDFLKLEG